VLIAVFEKSAMFSSADASLVSHSPVLSSLPWGAVLPPSLLALMGGPPKFKEEIFQIGSNPKKHKFNKINS
jgi:hypothetical protein